MKQFLESNLRKFTGPLTEDLVLRPGNFGLGRVPGSKLPDSTVSSVCGFCSTGCSLKVHVREGEAVNLSPEEGYPVNLGMACPKGWEALSPLSGSNRARYPMLKDASGKQQMVSWDEALSVFCDRFKSIQAQHGEDSLAFLSTGQITTEEMALLGGVAKLGMGIRHGDGNTRQCMATAATAYKESFGFDAPPFTYGDFEESDVIVFVGANPCIAHPIMWQRVKRNRRNPEIVVVDPRRTETAMMATRHLAIRPKSDLVLFYGIARILIERDWIDPSFVGDHTEGFEGFVQHVDGFSLERVKLATGLSESQILEFAELVGTRGRVSFWWTMGVNQSYEGTRLAQALINLALMTGNMGKPGTGANSITGQCNAMGSRIFSNTTGLYAGRSFEDAWDRREVGEILDLPEDLIPRDKGWAYDQIFDAVEAGVVKGLWIIATNPVHSWINRSRLEAMRANLEFLVVQEMYGDTETAQIADLVLPAAGWGEKDGTFVNSERRIGVTRKVSRAPGEALADFYIFKLVAHYWGCASLFERWSDPEAVFKILGELSKGRACDFSAIDGYEMIESKGGIQWPFRGAECDDGVERRLFEDGRFFHSSGRARFCYDAPTEPPESPDEEYPFWLLTGRGTSAQWHTQTRTGESDVLRKLYPRDCYVEINVDSARALGIRSNTQVRVTSRRGSLKAFAFVTTTVAEDQVFIPMHYSEINRLTLSSFDPYSRQPSYKACAVKIETIDS